MHRSATSLIARNLNHEVHMGSNLLKGLDDNPKGHYESVDVIKINDKILTHCGGSWCNPPSHDKILKCVGMFDDEMKVLIDKEIKITEEMGYESWGFKDPRTCLTIDLWLPLLPNPQFVVCYRDPMDIAKSLNNRNGFSIEFGKSLTHTYNERITNFITKWLQK